MSMNSRGMMRCSRCGEEVTVAREINYQHVCPDCHTPGELRQLRDALAALGLVMIDAEQFFAEFLKKEHGIN